jgi:hypothetical protein
MASAFSAFHATFPPDAGREPYVPARHDAFAERVPPAVLHEWREFGFGSYGHGIVWTVLPDEPFLDPDDWNGLDGTGIEILRSAFGDVCIWQGGRFLWVSVLSGIVSKYSINPEVVFISMTKPDYRKIILLERILHIGRGRFGELSKDDCFGFAPLPVLGGAIAEKYLIRTPMREYVAMSAGFLG